VKVVSAGIIAAGEGSRFKQQGIQTHKPLIPVGGFPLIGHTLRNLQAAGIGRAVIILNEQEGECVDWIREHFPSMNLEFIVKSTKSSFESFWRVGRQLGPGRHLLSTVDSICPSSELLKMAEAGSGDGLYLGVTSFVDDEKPLWVTLDPSSNRISNLGASSGTHATAGFYNVPARIFERGLDDGIASLRVFLKRLADEGTPVFGVSLAKVVDVDSPKDLAEAERMIAERERNPK
jgi:NDP-sugar pyrophosphorylase family protein